MWKVREGSQHWKCRVGGWGETLEEMCQKGCWGGACKLVIIRCLGTKTGRDGGKCLGAGCSIEKIGYVFDGIGE